VISQAEKVSGKTYRRADMERYALWSYVMDYTTFGTVGFHAVKWG
jgi:hypothetical protein